MSFNYYVALSKEMWMKRLKLYRSALKEISLLPTHLLRRSIYRRDIKRFKSKIEYIKHLFEFAQGCSHNTMNLKNDFAEFKDLNIYFTHIEGDFYIEGQIIGQTSVTDYPCWLCMTHVCKTYNNAKDLIEDIHAGNSNTENYPFDRDCPHEGSLLFKWSIEKDRVVGNNIIDEKGKFYSWFEFEIDILNNINIHSYYNLFRNFN